MTTAPIRNRTIRIFLSSTFMDMNGERDFLMRRTFPKLRKKAADKDVILTEVDLRWGISLEASQSGETLGACLREIDNSIPFFIGLVGNRYGWIPTASDVSSATREHYPVIDDYLRRQLSITEIEIQYGVLSRAENMNAFFFLREDRDVQPEDTRVEALKAAILSNGRYPVASYRSPSHLGEQIEAAFLSLLDSLFPDKSLEPWEKDQLLQQSYLHRLQHSYIPDEPTFSALEDWLSGPSTAPLVVLGEPGSGKSALLANWMAYQSKKEERVYDPVFFSVGGGSGQCSWSTVAESLARQIIRLYDLPTPPFKERWEEVFLRVIGQVEALQNKHLLIIIDAVNQLELGDNVRTSFPLPVSYPANIKVLLSTREDHWSCEELKARQYDFFPLKPLDLNQRLRMMSSYLSLYGKHPEERLLTRIADNQIAKNSLRLKTLLDELIKWGNLINLESRIDAFLHADSDSSFYSAIWKEYRHEFGTPCLEALSFLSLSRKGLSESDILGITGLSPLEWSVFSFAFEQYISFGMGLVSFSHDHLKAYFRPGDAADLAACHKRMGLWFQQEHSDRATVEAVYHLQAANQEESVRSFLKDPDTFIVLARKDPDLLYSVWSWLKEKGGKLDISHFFTDKSGDFHFYMDVARFLKDWVSDYNYATWFADTAVDEAGDIGQRLDALDLAAECCRLDWEPGIELKYLEASQQIRLKHFGNDSPQMAIHRFLAGKTLAFFGLSLSGISTLEKALQAQRQHPECGQEAIAYTLLCLGSAYTETGRFKDAENALQEAESLFLQSSGSFSIIYLTVLLHRSRLNIILGNFSEALSLLQTIHRKVNGSLNPLLHIHSLLTIGEAHGRMMDFNRSASYLGSALRSLGYQYKNLSNIPPFFSLRTGQAILNASYYDTAIDFLGLIVPFDEEKRFPVYYVSSGKRLLQKDRFEEAVKTIQEGLDFSIHCLGEDAPVSVDLRLLLGKTLYDSGKHEKGLESIRQARQSYGKIYGEQHPDTITSRFELCHREDIPPEKKLTEIEDCVRILIARYGDDTLLLLPLRFFQAGLLIQLNRLGDACKMLSLALDREVSYLWEDASELYAAEEDLNEEISDAQEWYQGLDGDPYDYLLAVLRRDSFPMYSLRVQHLYFTRIGQYLVKASALETALQVFVLGRKVFQRIINDLQENLEKWIPRG